MAISNDAVNDNLTVFTCIPFSSVKLGAKTYPTEVPLSISESGLPQNSVLMLQQIRTVSESRRGCFFVEHKFDESPTFCEIAEGIGENS